MNKGTVVDCIDCIDHAEIFGSAQTRPNSFSKKTLQSLTDIAVVVVPE
jgi:hypothetical protein